MNNEEVKKEVEINSFDLAQQVLQDAFDKVVELGYELKFVTGMNLVKIEPSTFLNNNTEVSGVLEDSSVAPDNDSQDIVNNLDEEVVNNLEA